MRISKREAQNRLAQAGFELGEVRQQIVDRRRQTRFQVTTPLGNQVLMEPRELIGLLRDLTSWANMYR